MFNKNDFLILKEIDEKLNLDWYEICNKYLKNTMIKKGNTHFICCPFHGEDTASFGISFEKRIMKCFGCGKYYNNIIQFLKDYLLLSTQGIVEMLIKDGYIKDGEILGKNLNNFMFLNLQRRINGIIDDKIDPKSFISKRILFYRGGVGKITKEKIEIIKKKTEKKLEKMGREDIISFIEKNKGNYGLILNESSNILYYGEGQKAILGNKIEKDIHYCWNQSLYHSLNEIEQEKIIINNLTKGNNPDLIENFYKNKSKSFLTKEYKEFLKNLKIDPNKYIKNLIKIFYLNNNSIDFIIGEGFFDVYSLFWGIPFTTYGVGIGSSKINKFIKKVSYRMNYQKKQFRIMTVFDNDKRGFLMTARFINQYVKELRGKISKPNLLYFDFKSFNLFLKKYLSILVYIKTKLLTEEKITEKMNEIRNNIKYIDTLSIGEDSDFSFFGHFGNIETDQKIINIFKKKFLFSYDKDGKGNLSIKDMGELPAIIFGIQIFLEKIESKINNQELKNFCNEFLLSGFKSLFFKSFKNSEEFSKTLQFNLESEYIQHSDLDFLKFDGDYLLNKNQGNKNPNYRIENVLKNNISKLNNKIDLELNFLIIISLLSQKKTLKREVIIKEEDKKKLLKELKNQKNVDNLFKKISLWIDILYKEDLNETEIIEKSKMFKKILLIIFILENITNITNEIIKDNVYLKLKFSEEEMELIKKNQIDVLSEEKREKIKLINFIFNHYSEISDIIFQKIGGELEQFNINDNFIDSFLLMYAVNNIIYQ